MASSPKKPLTIWTQVGFYTSLGFILPAGALAGAAAGWLLDHWLHTSPVLALVMGFLGAGGGFLELLRILKRAEKDADGDNSSPGTGSG